MLVMTRKRHLPEYDDVRRLAGIWSELRRVEQSLTGVGRVRRHSDDHALPDVVARLGAAVVPYFHSFDLTPEVDWTALVADLSTTERQVHMLL